ncbi:MAG: selenide, water dikinase SelD [Verrucomicrobiota bacterium]|nr:selenide, water dikinase SelD [Verrucomicrobiota bacterium]MEE2967393.1 selenide, water dikinase SelD [Verrucomicrobiota bacterium]
MDPVGLGKLLDSLPKNEDPNLLVGFETSDDAGVYRLTDEIAIINTADYITPPVNDPFIYGQIAAANSISDVYAMGGRPVTCLNLVNFPDGQLPPEELHKIIAGALDKITESGAVLAGGHTVEDSEPKFGLSVTGVVHPEKIWRNVGALPGDALILTKPIGSGVIFNANLKDKVSDGAFESCINTVISLNRSAAEVFANFEIHAATDITGFGLAGHGLEMAQGSESSLHLNLNSVPVMEEAYKMYEDGVTTGVNKHNRKKTIPHIRFENSAMESKREILFDPQTSGGLFVALPEEQAKEALEQLNAKGISDSAIVGYAKDPDPDIQIIVS